MMKHCLDAIKAYGGDSCENADGESVLWAASRLYSRPEKRKILFVISDGEPQNAETGYNKLGKHLKKVVDMISKKGIECVGIGIQTDAVEEYYKNNVVLNDMGDMVNKIYAKIVEALRGAKRSAVA
jgi:cobalamin biosynthesis protein CobT